MEKKEERGVRNSAQSTKGTDKRKNLSAGQKRGAGE